MRILHLDTETTWRGGEQQVQLLMTGLLKRGIASHVGAAPEGPLYLRMKGLVPVFPVRMPNDLDFIAVVRTVRYCLRNRIDIIHAHTTRTHALGFFVRRVCPTIALVVHRRVDFPPAPNFGNRLLYLSGSVNRFIAISGAVAEVLHQFAVPAELLEALFLLREWGVAFHCLIAGEGLLEPQLRAKIAALKLSSHVTLCGFREDVPNLLGALDAFVMSSKTEGLGTAVLESFHAGTCVVATRAGGIPEMIEDGKTGLLSPPGDPHVFSHNLQRVIEDVDLRRRLAQEARRLAAQRFSVDGMIEATLSVYRELAGCHL